MYIKKRHQKLLDLGDKKFTITKTFEKFINKKSKPHNLIIKSKNNINWCTYCNLNFVAPTLVNSEVKCPNCKQKLLVKSSWLTHYEFRDTIQYLDKLDGTLILRTFELYSSYNNKKVSHHITEFMRTIIEGDKSTIFLSNQVCNFLGLISINHNVKFTHWHKASTPYTYYNSITGMLCPYNIKSVLNNTKLKYSGLEKMIARLNYIDFMFYYNLAHYPSFELLIKMKLYSLAESANKFYKGKNFQEVFGVSKSFYPFMEKYNINYKQLKILRLIQKEDIKLINNLMSFGNLEELAYYVDLEEAYNKVLKFNKNHEYEYLDYLKMADMLKYPMKDKRILYPKNLKKAHDKVMKLYKVIQNELIDEQIKNRLDKLNKRIYKNKKYVVFPAPSVASLIDESKQQNNCVKSYCEDYGLGRKDLFFMRLLDNQEKSLVTIEVRNNEIVQARIYDNAPPTKEQQQFLEKWQNKILSKQLT